MVGCIKNLDHLANFLALKNSKLSSLKLRRAILRTSEVGHDMCTLHGWQLVKDRGTCTAFF